MFKKISENRNTAEDIDAQETARIIGLSAIKYGDLSNQASKDYVFDVERFTSFEGDTGPYILYTIVRIKSILKKYMAQGGTLDNLTIGEPANESEKNLMLSLTGFIQAIETAYADHAPHKVCAYIYELANAFNSFYHETKILGEADQARKEGMLALLLLTRNVLETCIDLLGFEAPERM